MQSLIEEQNQRLDDDSVGSNYDGEYQKLVKFCEEVTVIHIERKSDEEADLLFWHAADYVRMRAEDQITTTRRARSRVREMKRRMTENSRLLQVTSEKGASPGGSMDMYEHSDSMRLTLTRIKTQRGVTCIANAA
jgi:hypothetical protein